jgi:hypothetical protein
MPETHKLPEPDPPRRARMSLKLRLLLIRRIAIAIGAALLTYGILRACYGTPHLLSAVSGALILGFFGPTVYCESDNGD